MKKILWGVLFALAIMLSIAIGDFFFDGWLKFVPMSLLFGFLVPINKEKTVNQKGVQ